MEKIDRKFFNELTEALDELFPKGKCKEREQALVLATLALEYFRKYRKKGKV